MIFLPSIGQAVGCFEVCVHIKYVSTGKAYWLDATAFAWSDNGLDQMIDSLCKYVFAAASRLAYPLAWCFQRRLGTYRCYVGPGSWRAYDQLPSLYPSVARTFHAIGFKHNMNSIGQNASPCGSPSLKRIVGDISLSWVVHFGQQF